MYEDAPPPRFLIPAPNFWDGPPIRCEGCKKKRPATEYYMVDHTRSLFCVACRERSLPSRHAARARAFGVEGSFTYEEWVTLREKSGNKCARCGATERLCVDHIIPMRKGGTNWISNIQVLCISCNLSKYNLEEKPREDRPAYTASVSGGITQATDERLRAFCASTGMTRQDVMRAALSQFLAESDQ